METKPKVEAQYIVSQSEIEMINNAVTALLDTKKKIDAAKDAAQKADVGQLRALLAALKDYPGAMTEDVWDNVYKANVSERLKPRFDNPASRDVIVNRLKVATIGITLAKEDRQ